MALDTVAKAARMADFNALKELIDLGHPVDVSDNRGYRPTHDAVDSRSFKCLDYLLQQEATDINWKSHDGVTTLLLAIRTNQFRLAQLLVSYGADVNIADHMQVTPLLAAMQKSDVQMVKLLVEKGGADVQVQDYAGWSVLHIAAERNLPSMVTYLLANGADVKLRDEYGLTPILVASRAGHLACLQSLLASTTATDAVNISAHDQATPVFLAAQEGHADCVQLLCDNGAICNIVTDEPKALPLHAALEFGHIKCVEILAKKTDFSLLSSCDVSPYEFAAHHSDSTLTKLLIESGLSVNYRHKCSRDYRPAALRYLDCTVRYDSEVSALTNVLLNKLELSSACALMEAGADVNPASDDDLPPLLAALDRCQYEMVCSLVLHGARVNLYHEWITANMTLVCSVHNWSGFVQMLLCGAEVQSLLRNGEDEAKTSTDLKHYLGFDEILIGARIIMRKRGTSVGMLLLMLLNFATQVPLSEYLLSLVDSDLELLSIKSIIGSPRLLSHLCRCSIRAMFSPIQLLLEKDVESLPLPKLLIDFILHRDLLHHVTNDRCILPKKFFDML